MRTSLDYNSVEMTEMSDGGAPPYAWVHEDEDCLAASGRARQPRLARQLSGATGDARLCCIFQIDALRKRRTFPTCSMVLWRKFRSRGKQESPPENPTVSGDVGFGLDLSTFFFIMVYLSELAKAKDNPRLSCADPCAGCLRRRSFSGGEKPLSPHEKPNF